MPRTTVIAGAGVAALSLALLQGGCATATFAQTPSDDECAVIRAVLDHARTARAWKIGANVHARLAPSGFRSGPAPAGGRPRSLDLDVRRCSGLAAAPSGFRWTILSERYPLRIGRPIVSGEEAFVSFGSRYGGHDYRLKRVQGEWRVDWRSETEVWIT